MIILKEIILLLIIIEPFEERLDGATDSLHAYAIGPRLFCLREFCYLAKKDCGCTTTHFRVFVDSIAWSSGRSVLAGGSGSSAAYASQTRFAPEACSYAFLRERGRRRDSA